MGAGETPAASVSAPRSEVVGARINRQRRGGEPGRARGRGVRGACGGAGARPSAHGPRRRSRPSSRPQGVATWRAPARPRRAAGRGRGWRAGRRRPDLGHPVQVVEELLARAWPPGRVGAAGGQAWKSASRSARRSRPRRSGGEAHVTSELTRARWNRPRAAARGSRTPRLAEPVQELGEPRRLASASPGSEARLLLNR